MSRFRIVSPASFRVRVNLPRASPKSVGTRAPEPTQNNRTSSPGVNCGVPGQSELPQSEPQERGDASPRADAEQQNLLARRKLRRSGNDGPQESDLPPPKAERHLPLPGSPFQESLDLDGRVGGDAG